MQRVFPAVAGILLVAAWPSSGARGGPGRAGAETAPQVEPVRARHGFDARAREAVDRGLAFLARRQNPNGSWHERVGYSLSGQFYGDEAESVYATSLACLALMGSGHVPGRGRYGREVDLAVGWLLSKSREEDGYITHAGSRMYEHALATLCLAEAAGMSRRRDLRTRVKTSIHLLATCQNVQGGWRHQPIPVDADMTVTGLVIQALRAARNAGIAVPLEVVDGARKFIERCASRSGFAYQPHGHVTYGTTCCGIVSLFALGTYDAPDARTALRALQARWLRTDPPGRLHYFYQHFFASQATYIAGADEWGAYFPRVRDEILRLQHGDGHWVDDVGPVYATAMACLVLQMPCEYLPLFQR
jgi:hypothetical protein